MKTTIKKIVAAAGVVAAFASVNYAAAQGTSTKKVKLIEKSIQLPGRVSLKYVEQGSAAGIPVIFLHGLTDSWHSFESTIPYLPASIHAFAISQRGHGDSERPLEGYRPREFAADVAAFIKEKKLGPVIIVGHSMGGVHTQQFAIDYPQLVRGAVIVSSGSVMKNLPGMPEFHQEVEKLDRLEEKFMDEFQKSTLAKPIDSSYYDLLVDEGMKTPLRVFKAALKGLMSVDYSNQLGKISVPVLILWGDRDNFFGRPSQDLMKTSIKDSKLIVYEGTGHALHWEEPERFAKDITEFAMQK